MNPLVRQMMEDDWSDKAREPLHQLHHWAQQQQPQPPMVLTPLQPPPQPQPQPQPQNPPPSDLPSQPPAPLATIVEPPEESTPPPSIQPPVQPPSVQPPPDVPVQPVKVMKDSEVTYRTLAYPLYTIS